MDNQLTLEKSNSIPDADQEETSRKLLKVSENQGKSVYTLKLRYSNNHHAAKCDDPCFADRETAGSDLCDHCEHGKFEPLFYPIFKIEKVEKPKPAYDYVNSEVFLRMTA